MEVQAAEQQLVQSLCQIYASSEAESIADWVMEAITSLPQLQRRWNSTALTNEQEQLLAKYSQQLMNHVPPQYVLNKAYFLGMELYVNNHVLIPRPETEELAQWAISWAGTQPDSLSVLDIGTGSGCLSLAIKKKVDKANVWAIDFSPEALQVAERNANTLGLQLQYQQLDFLNEEFWHLLPLFHLIVSNPPYITEPEKLEMDANVLQHEPHSALFVTNNDPLQFYKKIEQFANSHLLANGAILLELHQDFALDTQAYFSNKGWQTELRKDLNQNNRMLFCKR